MSIVWRVGEVKHFTKFCKLKGFSASPTRSPTDILTRAVDGSARHVAEENIANIPEEENIESIVDSFPMEIGQYFLRWDDEAKIFVSNVRDQYPED